MAETSPLAALDSRKLDFTFFDCDNHYYEALDAFTRHIEPEYRKRAIQWAQLDDKQRLLVGGKVNRFIPNPTFDPVAKPGAMDEYFRGRNPKNSDMNALFGELEPTPAAYRDRDARLALSAVTSLPSSVDLSAQPDMPPVYDQGQLGSCTANAIAAAVDFQNHRQDQKWLTPSRLWIYYQERVIEGTVSQDSGAQIRDGMKAVAKLGVCPETDWPYDISKFTNTPSDQCYREALQHRVTRYQRIPRVLNQFKGCLAHGFTFVFGFRVYESFESDEVGRTGVVPMPATGEQALGGHAVLAVGYDDEQQRFIVRNSWGEGWGMGGYFTLPYAYLMDRGLASDFWTVLQVA